MIACLAWHESHAYACMEHGIILICMWEDKGMSHMDKSHVCRQTGQLDYRLAGFRLPA